MANATPVHSASKAPKAAPVSEPQAPVADEFKELQDAAAKEGKSAFMVHGDPKAQPALRVDH